MATKKCPLSRTWLLAYGKLVQLISPKTQELGPPGADFAEMCVGFFLLGFPGFP